MQTTISEQIVACETSLLEAMKTSDVELLDALLHDGLLFNGPTGETATKAADLTNYRSGTVHLDTVAASDRQIQLFGDTAVVAVSVTLKGSYLGQTIDGTFRYLRVWKQANNSWKVIGGSVVPLQSQ